MTLSDSLSICSTSVPIGADRTCPSNAGPGRRIGPTSLPTRAGRDQRPAPDRRLRPDPRFG